MSAFQRYIGIDYSGAQTPDDSLKGLRVYIAQDGHPAVEVPPPVSPRKYWTRRGIANWLVETLQSPIPTLVGIDHGFSFPLRYFEVHQLQPDWYSFLEDFHRHWPTDERHVYVDFVRNGSVGNGSARQGNATWRRETELRCKGKSVFHFDVQGSVAKSTHAGIPWLLHLHKALGSAVHFWPFDGWEIPQFRSAIVEVYPALWKHLVAATSEMTSDQHDAYAVAMWLQRADANGELQVALRPELNASIQLVAGVEGWILGVF